jgi:hypothetical protein
LSIVNPGSESGLDCDPAAAAAPVLLAYGPTPAGYVDLGEFRPDDPGAAPAAATLPVSPAAVLAHHWQAEGYRPGLPSTMSERAAAIDRLTVKAMKCPACRRRGMTFNAFHNPRSGRYRVLAACSCGGAEEV